MGYIQDKLKEALGGSNMDNKNTVVRDWTPNNIKVLVISRYYILIIYHVGGFGGSKVLKLNIEEVKSDLDRIINSGSSVKLNSILKRRSLSCLEEIYVDPLFMNYPPIIDLVGYVQELVNSTSRLRYFGYGDFPLESEGWIKTSYSRNKGNLDYSIAKDESKPFKLEFREVNNKEWYRNYYLRPKYYKLDEEDGKLALHFKKFERDYKTILETKDENASKKLLEDGLKQISKVDYNNVMLLRKFDILLSHLSKGSMDNVKNIVLKVCKNKIRIESAFEGLTKDLAYSILNESNDRDYLLKSYERFGVLDTSSKSLNKNNILSYINIGRGFINIGGILDSICTESSKLLIDSGYKDLVGMALIMKERNIPEGNLRSNYIRTPSVEGDLEGYFDYLEELIGVVL